MFRHTTIFATARKGHVSDGDGSAGYHRPQYIWSFGVESRPPMGLGETETSEYGAAWDDKAGQYTILRIRTQQDRLVGRIAISDGSHESPDHFAQVLQKRLVKQHSGLDAESNPEEWFRHALDELQEEKVLTSFDRDAFFRYAHGFLASRESGEAEVPTTVVYPELRSHPKHHHKSGFWVSSPMASEHKSEGGHYGGLM